MRVLSIALSFAVVMSVLLSSPMAPVNSSEVARIDFLSNFEPSMIMGVFLSLSAGACIGMYFAIREHFHQYWADASFGAGVAIMFYVWVGTTYCGTALQFATFMLCMTITICCATFAGEKMNNFRARVFTE